MMKRLDWCVAVARCASIDELLAKFEGIRDGRVSALQVRLLVRLISGRQQAPVPTASSATRLYVQPASPPDQVASLMGSAQVDAESRVAALRCDLTSAQGELATVTVEAGLVPQVRTWACTGTWTCHGTWACTGT